MVSKAAAAQTQPQPRGTGMVHTASYPWVVLAIGLLVQTTASLGNQAISPLAPFLVADFDITRGQLGLLVTTTYLGSVLIFVLAGSLSDRFGVRFLFLLGLIVAGVALGIGAGMPAFTWLLLPMLVFGIGNGFALPPTTRAIVEWFPSRHRSLAMGIKQTGVALAGVVCGLAVPPMAQAFGWRGALLVLGVVTVGGGGLAWVVYRDRPRPAISGPATPRPGVRAVLVNRSLLYLCGVTWLYSGVQLSIINFLVLFLRERVGLSLLEAGALLSLTQVGGVSGRIAWGLISDAFFGGRRRPPMALIAVIAATCSLLLSFVGPETPGIALWPLLFLAGFSAIGWNGVNMTFVAEIAGRDASATAAGLNLTASCVGVMMFPPLFGFLVDVTGSYTYSFQAGAVASILALLLLARVRSPTVPPGS